MVGRRAAFAAVLVLGSAHGFILQGSAPPHRPPRLAPPRCCAASLPVSAKSTLAELRAYIDEKGLDIKTAGPGRNKKAILADILQSAPAVAAAPAPPKSAPAPVKRPAVKKERAPEAEAPRPKVVATPADASAARAAKAAEAAAAAAATAAGVEAAAQARARQEEAVQAQEEILQSQADRLGRLEEAIRKLQG